MGGSGRVDGRRRTVGVAALATIMCLGTVSVAPALELPAGHDASSAVWASHHVEEVATASGGMPIEGGTRRVALRIERHWRNWVHVGDSPLFGPERRETARWQFVVTECGSPCWEDREQTWYGGPVADGMITTTDDGDRRFTVTAECGEIDVTWLSDPEERQLPGPPPDGPRRPGITLQESYATHRGGPTATACGHEVAPHTVHVTETVNAGAAPPQ